MRLANRTTVRVHVLLLLAGLAACATGPASARPDRDRDGGRAEPPAALPHSEPSTHRQPLPHPQPAAPSPVVVFPGRPACPTCGRPYPWVWELPPGTRLIPTPRVIPTPIPTPNAREPRDPAPTLSDADALERASVGGKYRTLLRRIAVPADRAAYGDFCDWGMWTGTAWAGHRDLPAGHWVYVFPHWYIWRDAAS